jgi:hypothetical protein
MKLTRENRSTRGKPCPSATSSVTNPTWTDPGSNPGLCGGRPEYSVLIFIADYLHLSFRGTQSGECFLAGTLGMVTADCGPLTLVIYYFSRPSQ